MILGTTGSTADYATLAQFVKFADFFHDINFSKLKITEWFAYKLI